MMDTARWPQLTAAFSAFRRPVVIIDLEATGGNPYTDRITEIAFLRFDGNGVSSYRQLVNPQRNIPEFVSNLTGIDDAMVADAPPFADLSDDLLHQLRGTLLLAHNSKFDYTFLRHEFSRCRLSYAAPTLCTVQLSRRLYPQFFKHNLDSIIERHQIAVSSRHRAMNDVLALADYLELTAASYGVLPFVEQGSALTLPKLPPVGLHPELAGQLNTLSDGHGALLWLDSDGLPLYADAHTKTFREAVELLHRNPALQQAASLRFLPAVGPLHALMLKAKLSAEHGFRPSENDVRPTDYFTVRFHPNEKGKLQAQICPLSDGLYPDRPNGLFLHKKAAKRALDAWAREQQFCPAELNILPPGYDRNAPCPVAAVGRCQGQCGNIGEAAWQRQRIETAARLLPVADWGKAHQIEICETDTLNGRRLSFHCAGGALQMPDGSWYFDRKLPAVFKEKFRAHRNDIAVSF